MSVDDTTAADEDEDACLSPRPFRPPQEELIEADGREALRVF